MNNLMNFEGNSVEVFEWNGQVLFNPRHVGNCLELSDSAVRNYLAKMNKKQAIVLKNSDVRDKDIRKLNNAGEKFLTESGVYKLIFKSRKPEAERFSDWVADDVLPRIRKTGSYEMPEKEKNKKGKTFFCKSDGKEHHWPLTGSRSRCKIYCCRSGKDLYR